MAVPEHPESGQSGAEPPRPDRLPLFVLVVLLLTVPAAAGTAAYLSWQAATAKGTKAAASTVRKAGPTPHPTPPKAVRYAGLTRHEAAKLAASDLSTLLKGSGTSPSQDVAVATADSEITRARCFDSSRWRPYWRVTFLGGSPVFESKRQALLFCNHNPAVIVVTAPLRH